MAKDFVHLGQTNLALLRGQEDLSTWDDEELRRGKKRDKHGAFRGRDPVVVPKALHDELYRRVIRDAEGLLRKSLPEAVANIAKLANDPEVDAGVRLKANTWIAERLLGKTPERVQVEAHVTQQGDAPAFAAQALALLLRGEQPQIEAEAEFIDVDAIEADDDEEDVQWD